METLREFISSCLACIPGFGPEGQDTANTGEPVGIMVKRANRKVGANTTSDMKIPDAEKETPDYSVFTVEAKKNMQGSTSDKGKKYPKLSKPKKGQLILVKSAQDQSKGKRQGIFPSLPKGPTSLVSNKKQSHSPAVSRAVSAMQAALDRFRSEDDCPVTPGSSVYQREGAMSTLLGVQNWEDVVEGREAARPATTASARETDEPATSSPWPSRASCSEYSDLPPTPDLDIVGMGYGGPSQRQLDKKYVLEKWFKRGGTENRESPERERLPRNAAPFLIDDPVAWEIDFAEKPLDDARRQRQQKKQKKIHKLRQQLKNKSIADQPDERLRSNGATSAVMWEIDFAEDRSEESHQKRLSKREKKLKRLAKKEKNTAEQDKDSQAPCKPTSPRDMYGGQDFKEALNF
ncbi:uncharacterized protein LOC116619143 [Nematostella vectensis]|uniref:uncharacterized protein LOC116619143 n=1 Tax=Nematostella vectensis TaxID=45351 RepID=UPI00207789DB|nr:uncharacterized protein LOC116619143 [Nematostella vectensis]